MLYDVVRHPNELRSPIKTVVNFTDKTQDTIESTQQRLNNEMLGRFHTKGLELSHESFVAVVQVGKYVFLAIMLPPYLCFYGIPRWLLVNLVPQLLMVGKEISTTVGKFVLELGKRIADVMKGLMEQLIGDALRLSANGAQKFWHHLTKGLQSVYGQLASVGRVLHKPIELAKHLSEKTKTMVKGIALAAREKAEGALAEALKLATDAVHFINQNVIQPVVTLLAPPLTMGINIIKNGAATVLEKVKGWSEKTFSVLERVVSKSLKIGKKYAHKLLTPILKTARETLAALERTLLPALKKVTDPLAEGIMSVQAHAEKIVAPVIEMMKNALQVIPLFTADMINRAKMRFRRVNWKGGRPRQALTTWGHAAKSIAKGAWNGTKEIGFFAQRCATKFNGWLLKILVKIWEKVLLGIRLVINQLVLLPYQAMSISKVWWHHFKNGVYTAIFGVRIIIAILWASFMYAMFLIRLTKTERHLG